MFCCFKKKTRQIFVPNSIERLREFFIFCDGLEQHPFVVAHSKGGTLTLNSNFPETGEDTAVLNFDEIHLESFLTRLRQFVLPNELFYFKDLRRAVISEIGEDPEFKTFYDKLCTAMNRPFPVTQIQAFKPNGADIIAGFTFAELLKARLYTGAIHSEKRIDPTAPAAFTGVAEAHVAVSKRLTFVLAAASLKVSKNVFGFRNHILFCARDVGKVGLFNELALFDQRSKAAGH